MIKKNISTFFIAFAILLFSGCASRTSFPASYEVEEEVRGFDLPKLPEDGKALVYIIRPESFSFSFWPLFVNAGDGGTNFVIYVDQIETKNSMGYTNTEEYIYFNLMPGTHKIFSSAIYNVAPGKDEGLSASLNYDSIELDVQAGDVIFIEQETKFGFPYSRNRLHNDYSISEGKYRIKNLSLGRIYKLDKNSNFK